MIGAGAPGEVIAGRLGENGVSVAIVEERLVGGECSFFACMPSKGLLRPGEIAAEATDPGRRGRGELDAAAVLARRDEIVHDLDDTSMVPWLEERGVTLVRGHGRLAGEKRVVVGEEWFRRAARGRDRDRKRGRDPARPGPRGRIAVDEHRGDDGEARCRARLAILGGGVVGVEMAQAWSSLGSRVTVVHRGDRLIEREERFASEQVLAALREGGVDVRLGTSVTSVSRNGAVHVEVDDGAPFDADEILVSIGRTPRTHDIGLETVGLEAGGYIRTDESLRVDDRDWLYAIGDVNGRALLTHMGKYQGRLAADAIMGKDVRLRSDGAASPRVIFTDPQVGAVGLRLRARRRPGSGCGPSTSRRAATQAARSSGVVRRAPRASSSTRIAGSSSARRSPGRRSQRRSTRRRSPSSRRSRSTTSGTPCRRSPRARSSGCGCSSRTGCSATARAPGGSQARPGEGPGCDPCLASARHPPSTSRADSCGAERQARPLAERRTSLRWGTLFMRVRDDRARPDTSSMRTLDDGTLALSPSDLSAHLACPHLTTLSLAVARGELEQPTSTRRTET